MKAGLVALSLANLCFITPWFSLLYDADLGYFNKLPVTRAALLALLANLSGFAFLAWLIMRALHRFRNRWLHLTCHLGFLSLLLLPADFCRRTVFHVPDYQVVAFFRHSLVMLALAALLACAVWKRRLTARVAATVVGILSPLALFVIAKTILLLLGVQHLAQHQSEPSLPALVPVVEGRPRVVWIIFDETDQRLAFEQRPAKVQLPEFDRLRGLSLCATNAYSPADNTLPSMPGLILGRPVSQISIRSASDLTLTFADTGKLASWRETPSIFAAARDMGVNTALVGWAHPYARVLEHDLNFCEWYPIPAFEPARAPGFGSSMRAQIGCLAGALHIRELYANLCRASLAESLSVVTNASYGLVLLHLPPPHKPGIYNPDTDQFTIYGTSKVTGYFNNLILADRSLGKLRRAMEGSGEWDKSWLILSADHSWRESRLYDGRRDLRVPFLLKAPGGTKPMTYSPGINTVLTHDLILAILRGEISDLENAAAWLDAHRPAQPAIPKEEEHK